MKNRSKEIEKQSQPFDPKNYAKNGNTVQDIIRIKQYFDMFDTEKKGFVDPKILKQALEEMGTKYTSTAVYQLIMDYSMEGQGVLSFGRFADLMSNKVPQDSSREYIDSVFALFDTEKTGYISVKNLRTVVYDLNLNLTAKDIQDMIMGVDKDEDGLISHEQFYQMITKGGLV